MSQQTLKTARLVIRSFVLDDLAVIHRILDQTFSDGDKVNDPDALRERQSWLQWSILNQRWLPQLQQPVYGDRAVTLKATGQLIGSVGYVPQLDVYEQIPELASTSDSPAQDGFATTEFGLFWAIDPLQQGNGYATEAAQAMVTYAFTQWRLKRVIAATEYANVASQGVMRKLGMTMTRNPLPNPPWLQVVGILENNRPVAEIKKT